MPSWMKHSQNQDCQEKNLICRWQICRWHHPYGWKGRTTKEPLDKSERGEWKTWLKTQHLKKRSWHPVRWSSIITSRQTDWANNGNRDRLHFLGLQNHCRWWLHFSSLIPNMSMFTLAMSCVNTFNLPWNNGDRDRLYFLGLQNHCRWWQQPWNYKMLASWKKSYDKPGQHMKKQRQYFAD